MFSVSLCVCVLQPLNGNGVLVSIQLSLIFAGNGSVFAPRLYFPWRGKSGKSWNVQGKEFLKRMRDPNLTMEDILGPKIVCCRWLGNVKDILGSL